MPQDQRFLFVDVAALRAKQLRRGALNRLAPPPAPDEDPASALPVLPHKAERIAMEEVRRGFIQFDLPVPAAAPPEPKGDA